MANIRFLATKPTPPFKLGTYPVQSLKAFTPTLAIWAVGAGTAALFMLSVTPKIKRTLLSQIPVAGSYFEDHTPTSDKPF